MKRIILVIFLVHKTILLPSSMPVKQTLFQEVMHTIPEPSSWSPKPCGNFLCNNRSDYLLQSPEKIGLHDFYGLSCLCDEPKCHEFGDCCVDLVTDTWLETSTNKINGIASNLWSCEKFNNFKVKNYPKCCIKNFGTDTEYNEGPNDEYAWMISSCNPEADPFLIDNCIGNVDDDDYNYIHDIPRVLNNTNNENTLIFRNLYCVLCNDYALEDLIPINIDIKLSAWTISDMNLKFHEILSSPEDTKLNYTSQYSNDFYVSYPNYTTDGTHHTTSNYNADTTEDDYLIETIRNGKYHRGGLYLSIPDYCYIQVREYEDLINFSIAYHTKMRRCQPNVENKCPKNWTDVAVIKKCNSYSLLSKKGYRPTYPQSFYKNAHCAYCNGQEISLCEMRALFGAGGGGALSVVFHFTFSNDRGNIVGKDCQNGYFMDPLFEKCRPLFEKHPNSKFGGVKWSGQLSSSKTALEHIVDCDRLTLSTNEYHIFPNHSLYIKATKEVCSSSVSQNLTLADPINSFSEIQGYLTLLCTIISLIGLGLHISALIALPDLLNLPGVISLSTSLTLFFAQALFLWGGNDTIRPENEYLCIIVAATLHFLFLSVFSWTSVISYDILKTFLTSIRSRRKSGRLQFIKYLTFATSLPATIVVCSVLFDKLGPKLMISPGYGSLSSSICWFGNRLGLGLFFALPVTCLLIINLIMYTSVLIRIRKEQKTVSESLAQMNDDNQYTKIDFKVQFGIFNLMGGTWILGIVAGLIDQSFLWYLFIIFNGSQGAIIFLLFITKPRVWRMINEKLNCRNNITTSSDETNTSKNNKNNTAYDNFALNTFKNE